MKKSEKRYRRFDVQRNYQYETHDADGNQISDITESEWREKVVSEIYSLFLASDILELYYVFHDKDINDDGTSKGLHCHEVVTFRDNHTQTSVVKKLLASSLHNCIPCDNYTDSCRYLIHVSENALNDCKTIYPVEDVHGWKIDDSGEIVEITACDFKESMSRKTTKKARKEQKKVKSSAVMQVINGSSVVSDVRDSYYFDDSHNVGLSPWDFVDDRGKYRVASDIWLERITEFYQSHHCPLTSIYISGGGGTGKTSLANALSEKFADIHGVHKVASPGRNTTFDFAGNYKGERVSIFNEFSSAFPVEQFLSVFDPLNAMPVNSRNSDKLYFANYSIFTTSVELEAFIYNLWKPYAKANAMIPNTVRSKLLRSEFSEIAWLEAYMKYLPEGDDKILQIRRRLPIKICISGGSASLYYLDLKFNSAESFAFSEPVKDPYTKFISLPYDVSDLSCIADQTSNVVQAVSDCIDCYYKVNGLKAPEDFEKPCFEKR